MLSFSTGPINTAHFKCLISAINVPLTFSLHQSACRVVYRPFFLHGMNFAFFILNSARAPAILIGHYYLEYPF